MNKRDVIAFFDHCAQHWDAEQVINDGVIARILDNAHFTAGEHVLDVACGTGVMFPYYMERGAASVTGIDISLEMARMAAGRSAGEKRIRVVCGDVEDTRFEREFDQIMVYNAFPHFPEPEKLIAHLAELVRDEGRLTIAHGASRAQIDSHHSGSARGVSNGLMSAEDLQAIMSNYFDVDVVVSDDDMYQVSGIKRKAEA